MAIPVKCRSAPQACRAHQPARLSKSQSSSGSGSQSMTVDFAIEENEIKKMNRLATHSRNVTPVVLLMVCLTACGPASSQIAFEHRGNKYFSEIGKQCDE